MNKRSLTCLAAVLLSACSLAQVSPKEPKKYDAALAQKLGADQFGMKKYVMAFLKTGKKEIKDSTEMMKLQRAHLRNIQRLAAEGKLLVAGPFLDNQPLEGIFIFNVETVEEARKLTESDPAIQAGTLEMELHPWYGSAAIREIVRIHSTIQKKSITDQ